MTSALFDQVSVDILSSDNKDTFRASGSILKFDGMLKVYEGIINEKQESEKNDSTE